ncbi:MAG: 50S ribosomal protein L5 [Candidatus Woesearchaeota archaeon]
MNKMREIRIEKITLNIGAGMPGPHMEKAVKVLEVISGVKPVETKTTKRIPGWKIRPGLPIGCKVTLRGKKAEEVLSALFQAVDSKLPPYKFDKTGNLSFGIKEYIDIPGMKYDMSIGIIGLEVAVTLARPGFRIKRRRIRKRQVGNKHKITKEEAISFISEKFSVNVTEGDS